MGLRASNMERALSLTLSMAISIRANVENTKLMAFIGDWSVLNVLYYRPVLQVT